MVNRQIARKQSKIFYERIEENEKNYYFNRWHLVICFFMAKSKETTHPNAEWGKKLYKNLKKIRSSQGINKTTQENLAEISGVPLSTLRYYISGDGNPKINILLYFVFALRMEKEVAFDFLSSLGFSENFLSLTFYKDIWFMISSNQTKTINLENDTIWKEFVDDLIEKSKAKYR